MSIEVWTTDDLYNITVTEKNIKIDCLEETVFIPRDTDLHESLINIMPLISDDTNDTFWVLLAKRKRTKLNIENDNVENDTIMITISHKNGAYELVHKTKKTEWTLNTEKAPSTKLLPSAVQELWSWLHKTKPVFKEAIHFDGSNFSVNNIIFSMEKLRDQLETENPRAVAHLLDDHPVRVYKKRVTKHNLPAQVWLQRGRIMSKNKITWEEPVESLLTWDDEICDDGVQYYGYEETNYMYLEADEPVFQQVDCRVMRVVVIPGVPPLRTATACNQASAKLILESPSVTTALKPDSRVISTSKPASSKLNLESPESPKNTSSVTTASDPPKPDSRVISTPKPVSSKLNLENPESPKNTSSVTTATPKQPKPDSRAKTTKTKMAAHCWTPIKCVDCGLVKEDEDMQQSVSDGRVLCETCVEISTEKCGEPLVCTGCKKQALLHTNKHLSGTFLCAECSHNEPPVVPREAREAGASHLPNTKVADGWAPMKCDRCRLVKGDLRYGTYSDDKDRLTRVMCMECAQAIIDKMDEGMTNWLEDYFSEPIGCNACEKEVQLYKRDEETPLVCAECTHNDVPPGEGWSLAVCAQCEKEHYNLYWGTSDGDKKLCSTLMCRNCKQAEIDYMETRGYTHVGVGQVRFNPYRISCERCNRKSSHLLYKYDEVDVGMLCGACTVEYNNLPDDDEEKLISAVSEVSKTHKPDTRVTNAISPAPKKLIPPVSEVSKTHKPDTRVTNAISHTQKPKSKPIKNKQKMATLNITADKFEELREEVIAQVLLEARDGADFATVITDLFTRFYEDSRGEQSEPIPAALVEPIVPAGFRSQEASEEEEEEEGAESEPALTVAQVEAWFEPPKKGGKTVAELRKVMTANGLSAKNLKKEEMKAVLLKKAAGKPAEPDEDASDEASSPEVSVKVDEEAYPKEAYGESSEEEEALTPAKVEEWFALPSKGGLKVEKLRTMATGLGIKAKGMKKAELKEAFLAKANAKAPKKKSPAKKASKPVEEVAECQFVFTKGQNKGNRCPTKPKDGAEYCSKHKDTKAAKRASDSEEESASSSEKKEKVKVVRNRDLKVWVLGDHPEVTVVSPKNPTVTGFIKNDETRSPTKKIRALAAKLGLEVQEED